jgi:NADH:ubiquinone oxidoreductase subunit E
MIETTTPPATEAHGLCDNKRAIIDQIIADNLGRPGAMMVVLNETQGKIGYISPEMQVYIAKTARARWRSPWCCDLLFFLHH